MAETAQERNAKSWIEKDYVIRMSECMCVFFIYVVCVSC